MKSLKNKSSMFIHRSFKTMSVTTKLAGMVVVKNNIAAIFVYYLKLKHYETKNFYSSGSNRIIYCL